MIRAVVRLVDFIGWLGELYARGRARGYSRLTAWRVALPAAWRISDDSQ